LFNGCGHQKGARQVTTSPIIQITQPVPEVGQAVRVRNRLATVRAVEPYDSRAETAANLSNDEFFGILGIPELTNAEATKSKGLPGPLILKRNGCHVWQPENFPPDDPHYGWTWDDYWNDAIALLGSREAVEKYRM
jgi:hypothetical protein